MARAAQRYGIVVRDQSGVVVFYGEDPTPTGSNPYAGSAGYFGGEYPHRLLARFPWEQLKALPTQLSLLLAPVHVIIGRAPHEAHVHSRSVGIA